MVKTKIIVLLCMLLATMLLACSCDLGLVTESGSESSTLESTEKEIPSETEASNDTEETESTVPENTKVIYKVTVVDDEGNPLAGAFVQLCVGDLCKLPSPTDEEGVATFEFDEAEYTVKVTLSGYTGEASYSFPEESSELTVTLTKDAE